MLIQQHSSGRSYLVIDIVITRVLSLLLLVGFIDERPIATSQPTRVYLTRNQQPFVYTMSI
jgi:hypothetical protein